jgi:predicted membrane protein
MMQDGTICEGGSTLVFLFLRKNVFLSVALFGILFYRRRSRLFCIVVCVCSRHCVVLIPVRTLGRTACALLLLFPLCLLRFFSHKKRRKKIEEEAVRHTTGRRQQENKTTEEFRTRLDCCRQCSVTVWKKHNEIVSIWFNRRPLFPCHHHTQLLHFFEWCVIMNFRYTLSSQNFSFLSTHDS